MIRTTHKTMNDFKNATHTPIQNPQNFPTIELDQISRKFSIHHTHTLQTKRVHIPSLKCGYCMHNLILSGAPREATTPGDALPLNVRP